MRWTSPIACLALLSAAAGPASRPAVPPDRPPMITYLGLVTAPPTPSLRTQLSLPDGVGVLVEAVDRDGPAATAGVAVHDLITRIDDQIVVNVQQFGVLVRLRRAGETAKLALIRRGRPTTVPVTLGERPDTPDDPAARRPAPPGDDRPTSVVRHTDGRHTIVLTCCGEDVHARVIDASGRVVFEGPVNSPDDRMKMPPDCRAKVEAVKRNFDAYRKVHATSGPVP